MSYQIKFLIASALAILGFIAQAAESQTNWIEGTHYFKIAPPLKMPAVESRVRVTEFFWYGCSHCFDFEPSLNEWKKNKKAYIEFNRIPAIFDRKWAGHARAFYTARKLLILDDFHGKLFNSLHEKKEKIYTDVQIGKFFEKLNIKEEVFNTVFNSFEIDASARKALSLTRDSGISGVPSIVINGKYRTSVRYTGSFENLLKVVDYLASKEHKNLL